MGLIDEMTAEELKTYAPEKPDDQPKTEEKCKPCADLLVEIGKKTELFHDEYKDPYARVDHLEIMPIRSTVFRRWLSYKYYQACRKPAASESITQALGVLSAVALYEGKRWPLSLRVAEQDGAIYYDLGDESFNAVKVSEEGWEITTPPILFRRSANIARQVRPIKGGDATLLFNFLNINKKEERILLLVHVASCFIPGIPHLIPVFSGEKGSAKSTTMRVIRRLVDPAVQELQILPNDQAELPFTLYKNYAPMFDNISHVQKWQSDVLCAGSTGGAISKRKLYTDDEEILWQFRRCIFLNGITAVASEPDLIDRAAMIELNRIDPEQRRSEEEFWQTFEVARPQIIGGLLDAVAKAIKIRSTVKLNTMPRMADFAMWGYSLSEALGFGGDFFMEAYRANSNSANKSCIESNPVAQAIVSLMTERLEWIGTPADLLKALKETAEAEYVHTDSRDWPRDAARLSKIISGIRSNLREAGITVDRYELPDRKKTRQIRLRRKADNLTSEASAIPEKSSIYTFFGADGTSDGNEDLRTVKQ